MSIFTKIINKEINAYIVYEDDFVIAFLDISQATPGHTLVVPKEESKNIFEISQRSLSHVIKVVQLLCKKIQASLNVSNINILSNNGTIAGQSVEHLHFHLIPRYNKDEVKINFPNNFDKTTKEEFKRIQNLIKIN